jgi:hypothetical protein
VPKNILGTNREMCQQFCLGTFGGGLWITLGKRHSNSEKGTFDSEKGTFNAESPFRIKGLRPINKIKTRRKT